MSTISSMSAWNVPPSCPLRPTPPSSVVFWNSVHRWIGKSFSLQSEDVTRHYSSTLCLESLHACTAHHLFICLMIASCRGLCVGNSDGRLLACMRSLPFSSTSRMRKRSLFTMAEKRSSFIFKLIVIDYHRTDSLTN